jgi:hypothetical protein
MRTITSRDLKNNPAILASEGITVVTSKAKAIALCLPLSEGEDAASLAEAILRLRAQRALERIRVKAAESGAAELSEAEIDEEIKNLRVARNKGKKVP